MSDISGTYDIVANTPMGEQKMTLSITADGHSFSGTNSGGMGSAEISGTVNGSTISWKQLITVPMPLTLDCHATIEGGEISGTVDPGGLGNFPLKGRRVEQAISVCAYKIRTG